MNLQAICLLAAQIAKGGPGMVSIAGQMLTIVLEDLKLVRNLKMNRITTTLSVTPTQAYGPFPLEADYLRTYDMYYPIPNSAVAGGTTPGGITQFLTLISMEAWDAEFKDPSTANYPYEFATDTSTQAQVWTGGTPGNGTMTSAGYFNIYPMTSGTIQLTHRYMKNQPDYATPESSTLQPWFPHTMYLVTATAAHLMGVTGDDRKDKFHAEAEHFLAPYLIMESDEVNTTHSVRLDPRRFRFSKALKPVKAFPFS